MTRIVKTRLVAAAIVLVAPPSYAQSNGRWQHGFATYLIAAGLDGNVGIGPLSGDVDVSFDDLLDHLELGLMMAYAAERDDWMISVDAIYMNLEARKDASGLTAEAKANQAIVSADVAYRMSDRFEVLAGLRYNDIETDLAVSGLPGGTSFAGERANWVDPYIGGRYTLPLAQRWSLTLRADVGGFGVGADSTWHLVSRVNWHASDSLAVSFGYRVLAVDYDDGEGAGRLLYDVEISGPLVGVGWRY